MTTPSAQADTRPARSAVADFIESSDVRGGMTVTCSARRVRIRVTAPPADAPVAARDCPPLTGVALRATVRQQQTRPHSMPGSAVLPAGF